MYLFSFNIIIYYFKIIIIIISLYNINLLFFNVETLIYNLKSKKEIIKIENYLNFCTKIKKLKTFKKIYNPMISIISPVFNRERFLIRLIRSIQYQSFNNIEIIFVDDCSKDKSVKIIDEYKQEDERIILIKNKKNKGTFQARNLGVIYSRGKYLIIPDPDDILSKDILNTFYNFAEKFNCEIIRFSFYRGNGIIAFDKYVNKYGNKLIYQPELSTNIFYGNNELEIIDYNIYNKFIKKEVYIKSLNILNHFYLNMHMTFMEDSLMNYILLRTAKILYFSKKIGYYNLKNSISITKNLFKINQLRIQFIFIYLKLIFEYSKNTKFEKDMANLLFTNIIKNFKIKKFLSKLIFIDNFKFYNNIIKMYLNCKFIDYYNKYTLKNLNKILKKEKNF